MKKISEMENYIVNFAQENMKSSTPNIEDTVKKYLLRLKTNVAELNKKYIIPLYLASTKNINSAKLI